MPWWCYSDGRQDGPLDDAELSARIAAGRATGHSLVWREGMVGWVPLGAMAAAAPPAPAVPPAPAAPLPPGAAELSGVLAGRAFCCQCALAFGPDDLLQYAGYRICGACKPSFFQRLAEGVLHGSPEAQTTQYGGFWIRFAAKLLDGLILGPVVLVLLFIMGLVMAAGAWRHSSPEDMAVTAMAASAGFWLAMIAVQAAYATFFVGRWGATPGKMICGLKVVLADGGKVTYARAFGRFWAEAVSYMAFLVGYIMAAWDEQKRAMHDHMCDTRVVRK